MSTNKYDSDTQRYLDASSHHYFCNKCNECHDDRGIPEGTCTSPEEDQISELRAEIEELKAQYKGATIRAETAEIEHYSNACANVRDAQAQLKPPHLVPSTNQGLEEFSRKLSGTGRDQLIFLYHQSVCDAITALDEKNILAAENIALKCQLEGIVLKGWKCSACGIFNGEEKERRSECRACGLARKT